MDLDLMMFKKRDVFVTTAAVHRYIGKPGGEKSEDVVEKTLNRREALRSYGHEKIWIMCGVTRRNQ